MTDCEFCGNEIDEKFPQKFCVMCGASFDTKFSEMTIPSQKQKKKKIKGEISPEGTEKSKENGETEQYEIPDLDANSQESFGFDSEDSTESLNFVQKMQVFYLKTLYDFRFSQAKKNSSLLLRRDLLLHNQALIYKYPLIYSETRKEQLIEELNTKSKLITSESYEISLMLKTLKELYNSEKFWQTIELYHKIKKQSNKNGLYYWKYPSYFQKLQAKSNLNIIHKITKYGDAVPQDILDKDLIRQTYTLNQSLIKLNRILEDPSKIPLIHPSTYDKVKGLVENYKKILIEKKIELPLSNFSKNLTYWFGNTLENIPILIKNLKFQWMLIIGNRWNNLPKAWDSIQKAGKIIEEYPFTIYYDYIDKHHNRMLETQSLIEKLQKETQEQLSSAHDLMEKFLFNEAIEQNQSYIEKLKTYKMSILISQMEEQLAFCKINLDIYSQVLVIEDTFGKDEFLAAYKAIEQLKSKLKSDFKPEDLIDTLKTKIDSFSIQINSSREEGESKLQNLLKKTIVDLKKHLDFEEVQTNLISNKELAEVQEYSNYLKDHHAFYPEFESNFALFKQYNAIQSLISFEKFGESRFSMDELLKSISKSKIEVYPKLVTEINNLDKSINEKIDEEKQKLDKLIESINDSINNLIDIESATSTLSIAVARNNVTGLDIFKPLLEAASNKIALNKEGLDEMLRVQKIFSEGDIKEAHRECEKILSKIKSTLSKSPGKYSEKLKNSVETLLEQINVGLKDGVENLNADYAKIPSMIKNAFDFSDIIGLLGNYQIRAQRLGLHQEKNDMNVLMIQCKRNQEIMIGFHNLESKYNSVEDFLHTLSAIKSLAQEIEVDNAVFEHVKKKINTFQEKVNVESKDRETRMEGELSTIIEKEINQLSFVKAIESLNELTNTAKNLAVISIQPKIKEFLQLSSNHQSLLVSLEEAIAIAENGKIIEAQELVNGLQTAISQYKGTIITPMRNHVTEVGNKIQGEIENSKAKIKENLVRIVKIIEEKQAKTVYEELMTLQERAEYLKDDGLYQEIEGLIKLCELQFDPAEFGKKKKKQKVEQKAATEFVKKSVILGDDDLDATTFVERASSTTLKVKKLDFSEQPIPEFDSVKERREYKRKLIRQERARIIKAPKVEENKNNEVRSSSTRQVLQHYSRQINQPVRRGNRDICLNCGAHQKTKEEKFCFFCGHLI